MTEDEGARLFAVGDMLWYDIGALVAKRAELMPVHLREETLAFLQDKITIYGSSYEKS